MSLDSISGHAEACRERAYLSRWFPANIIADDEVYSFGNTELAIIEETLRNLENGQSVLVNDPLPSNRIALGLCLAYVRTQDPRFPEDGIVGGGHSLLGFPALHYGYVTDIDEFKLNGLGQQPSLIDREPIDQLSQVTDPADIHTAKNNFEFDRQRTPRTVGAVFVDLRKPEWGNRSRRFDEIMALCEASDCPFMFYTDEMTPAGEAAAMESTVIEVTNELLSTAESTRLPENPSLTTRFEHLINTEEISVEHVTIGYPELYEIVADLSAMRNDLQNSSNVQRVIKMEVGWLFNLLTRLPVKPEYWDGVVADNYYQQGVRELLENLRGKAQRIDGREADLLVNYYEAANALHGRLNSAHPLQDALFELISTDGKSTDDARAVVIKNDFERKAILQALTLEDTTLADNVTIHTETEISPTADTEVIVARPLDANSYLYDFPTANRIVFLQYEPWAPIVEDRIASGIERIGATIEKREFGQVGGQQPPEPTQQAQPSQELESSYDRPEDLDPQGPTETLRQDFEAGESASTSGASGTSSSSRDPDLEVSLSKGNARKLSKHTRVSVLKDNGDIGRKEAIELQPGETMLLLDSATEDIYDLFVESAHQKDQLRKAESVVERWRTTLDDGLSSGMTEAEVLKELQERGSDISDQSTISNWRTGQAIGPRDAEDVRRILDIFEPDMRPTYSMTANAMKQIRTEHRNIGRKARKAIESQMGGSITSDLSTDLPSDIDQSSQQVQKATVETLTPLDT